MTGQTNTLHKADFAQYGGIERVPLTRLQRVAAGHLTHSWSAIPHVTHHDEVDVTRFEQSRQQRNKAFPDLKMTMVPVLGKILAEALIKYPHFNASLDPETDEIILKKYVNIGFAIDTKRGLTVGVIRECNIKTIDEMAADLAELVRAGNARGLSLHQMSGGCMTLSSLGHIGGTGFTPIVNAPEVAILGVARNQLKAVPGDSREVTWRTRLPLSLSYDHRVINGAEAARFLRFVDDRFNDSELLNSISASDP